MSLLRWFLALACLAGLAIFVLILTVGKGFDAFRSAGDGKAASALTVALPVMLLAMLVALFTPNARLFLHLTAAGVALAAAGCLAILRTNPGEGALYLSFLALWLLYYCLTAWVRR